MTWTCLVTGVHFWRGTLKHSSRSTCRGTFRHSSRATSDIHSYHHRYHHHYLDDNYLIALLPRDIPGNVVALLPLLLPTHLTSQVIIPVTIVMTVFTTMIIHVVLFKLKFLWPVLEPPWPFARTPWTDSYNLNCSLRVEASWSNLFLRRSDTAWPCHLVTRLCSSLVMAAVQKCFQESNYSVQK